VVKLFRPPVASVLSCSLIDDFQKVEKEASFEFPFKKLGGGQAGSII
jgi:hypothetical protein